MKGFVGSIALIAAITVMGWWVFDRSMHRIEVRVCGTSTPADFQRLHCNELPEFQS